MNLKNAIRNLFRIRTERGLLPAGPKPPFGSNIVRDGLRIRLKYQITNEQWEWLTEHGWRTIDMRLNKRRYTVVPDKVVVRLLDADKDEREILHQRLIRVKDESDSMFKNSRTLAS